MKCRVVMAAALCGALCALSAEVHAKGFSTVLPFHIDMPSGGTIDKEQRPEPGGWEAAPLPRAMASPALRRMTAGRIVDFAKRFLPLGEGAPGHDPVTGAVIGAFGPAYRNASLVGHGLAPPGETVGR